MPKINVNMEQLSDSSEDDAPSEMSKSRKRSFKSSAHKSDISSPPKKKKKADGGSQCAPPSLAPEPRIENNFQAIKHKFRYRDSTDSTDDVEELDFRNSNNNKGATVLTTLIKPVEKKKSDTKYNTFAQKMMGRMGYVEGKGLGREGQGIVKPVEVSQQRGRRGLGHLIKGFEPADIEWDFTKEIVQIEETISWIPPHNYTALERADLDDWLKEGPKKKTIDDETFFCDPRVLYNVCSCKTVLDDLEDQELRKARTRSNPFETIRSGIFLNRAAMKMANMDANFKFMFTEPKLDNGAPAVGPDELLYFADVCAGPGGFTEYILWRKNWEAKGFGFTLKGPCDFKLHDFYAASCESFEPHYGVNGIDGDGDVYNPNNITVFSRFVMDNTEQRGVHFMMADGGFSVDGHENIQEILSKQIYICQCVVALSIVRPGGHFLCKLFDLFTPFSVGLIYLMYRAFQKVSIHKPNSSRPANSERYLVCQWKCHDTADIREYLYQVNSKLEALKYRKSGIDVMEIVPLSILQKDKDFYEYMCKSNNELGERQVINLAKIVAFCKDNTLVEKKQNVIKKQCLEFWKIPDDIRKAPPRLHPAHYFDQLLNNDTSYATVLAEIERELNPELLSSAIKSAYDWKCVILGSIKEKRERTFYMGTGRRNVYRWNGISWQKLDVRFELAQKTLVYGEIVPELMRVNDKQRRIATFHIIDGIIIGGIDIRNLHYQERHKKCIKFVKAMNKPSRPDFAPIKVKELFKMEAAQYIFERLELQVLDRSMGMGMEPQLVFPAEQEGLSHFIPVGMLFFKATEDPWMMAVSRKENRKYWYHSTTRDSRYECPVSSIAKFTSTYRKRIVWWWDSGTKVHDIHESPREGRVHRESLLEYIKKITNR